MSFLHTSAPREGDTDGCPLPRPDYAIADPFVPGPCRGQAGRDTGGTGFKSHWSRRGAAVGSAGCLLSRFEVWGEACGCRGPSSCLPSIHPRQLRGLYKGMSSPMAGVAFVNAIVFGVHGNMVKHIQNPDSLRYTPPPRRSERYL